MKPRAKTRRAFSKQHLVGDLLVDEAPQPLVAGLGRDRQRLLALPREDLEDAVLDRVDLDGRKRDVVPELGQALEDRRRSRGGRRRPSRSGPCGRVSGRASRAIFRIDDAGYCLTGAMAYAAQQKRHISVQPREISISSLSASSVRGVRIVVCGTSKVGVISLRDIGCWITTFAFSAASARGPCTAGTKKPGTRRRRREERRPGPGPTSSSSAIRGTSRSPSPSAKTSTKGESAAGFIRAMSPPTSSSGWRSSRRSRRSGIPRRRERAQDVDDVHLPRQRPGEQAELRERRSGLERRPRARPPRRRTARRRGPGSG